MSKFTRVVSVFSLFLVVALSYQIIAQGIQEARGVAGQINFGSAPNVTPAYTRTGNNTTTFNDNVVYPAPVNMRIDKTTGNVGVGTTNTTTYGKLDVASGNITVDSTYGLDATMRGGVGNGILNIGANAGTVNIAATTASSVVNIKGTSANALNVSGGTSGNLSSINAPSVSAASYLYSYGNICAGNSSPACTGSGGVSIFTGALSGTSAVAISGSGVSYFNGGNVGIGNTVGSAPLDVSSTAGSIYVIKSTATGAGSTAVNGVGAYVGVRGENTSTTGAALYADQFNASGYAVWANGGKNYFSGRVGIGTTNPASQLEVLGGPIMARDSGTVNTFMQGYTAATPSVSIFANNGTWPVSLGNSNNYYMLYINGTNGNVGIGTTGPAQKLDVNGIMQVSGNIVSIPGTASLVTDAHVTVPRTTAGVNQIFNKYNSTGSFYFRRVPNAANTSGYNDLLSIDNNGGVQFSGAYSTVGSGTSSIYWTANEGLTFRMAGNNAVSVNMENLNGTWRLINSAWNLQTLSLDQSGNLVINGTATKPGGGSWTASSDRRVKKDVTAFTDGLSVLEKIDAVNYTYNGLAGNPEGYKGIGVIAQDVLPVAPYTISSKMMKLHATDKELTKVFYFDPSALTYINLNATKELDKKTKQLEIKVAELTSKLDAQQSQIDELKKIVQDLQKKIEK